MKRRLAVILMADMVDYTAAMEADQAGAIALIRELRDRWLEPEATTRGGEVMKRMGDGWIIAFASVTDAVETAQAVQTGLAGHERIKLRIAAHLGEIAEDDADVYGTGVNITARLQTEAPPGGVMISDDLHRQLDARLAVGFGDAGSFKLKNVAQPVAAFQWRPSESRQGSVGEVPIIAIEPVVAAPDTTDTRDAAADLQEQLLNSLSRRTGIRVMLLDHPGLEAESSATYRLRSRLRIRGDAARITLSMIVCETGHLSWSASYEGASDDLFGLCDDTAVKADADIRYTINAADNDRLAGLPDEALSVSELRARAANYAYRASNEGFRDAVALLERALRLAPKDPMSLAMWADFDLRRFCGEFSLPEPDRRSRMIEATNIAVQGLPRSDYVYYARAIVRMVLTRDLDGARRDLERGMQINSGFVYFDFYRSWLELLHGNPDDALAIAMERWPERRQDVFWMKAAYLAAVAAILADRPAEALSFIEDAVETCRDCRAFHILLAEILATTGDEVRAHEVLQSAGSIPHKPFVFAPYIELSCKGAELMDKLRPTEPVG